MFILIIIKTFLIKTVLTYYIENDPWEPGFHEYHQIHSGMEHAEHFVNEWTVQLEGGDEVAQLVAAELGYKYDGPVLGFPNTYTFRKYGHEKQRRTPAAEHTFTLAKDRRIKWVEQLFLKSRVKRYPTVDPDQTVLRMKRLNPSNNTLEQQSRTTRVARNIRSKPKPLFNDELWTKEWYLQDTRTLKNLPRLDLNVLPVYAMGFNGSGIRVSVLDDGIEHNHTDLRDNYDPEISWDCNDNDPDPIPRFKDIKKNSHGTRCAGEIAMTANNVKCGVGVAWGAKVGGVRMLDGRITDRLEGEAIGYAWDKVDIYSASWGPNDDGRTVEGPGRLAQEAFKRGITKGRDGKGSIYVWANGNGGGHQDNCNCDGYSSSIYTISIGSASQHGLFPWYGETCSSTLATAYSSGAYKDQKIATTDTRNKCTLKHTGTSAAAPLAAGIIALALQANPNLTWRDVQHLIVWTSEYAPLMANPNWEINGVGLYFDVRFGFGLLNAGALVAHALNWTTVPEKSICRFHTTSYGDVSTLIFAGDQINVTLPVDNCDVNYLEHVELIITIEHSRRGALQIYLISPQGTQVQVLSARPNDASKAGFVRWPLTSVASWGENPKGIWKIIIEDRTEEENFGKLQEFTVVLHGTNEMPDHMRNGRRQYENSYASLDTTDLLYDDDSDGESLDNGDEEESLNNIDPTILAEVEKALQRIHHKIVPEN